MFTVDITIIFYLSRALTQCVKLENVASVRRDIPAGHPLNARRSAIIVEEN